MPLTTLQGLGHRVRFAKLGAAVSTRSVSDALITLSIKNHIGLPTHGLLLRVRAVGGPAELAAAQLLPALEAKGSSEGGAQNRAWGCGTISGYPGLELLLPFIL